MVEPIAYVSAAAAVAISAIAGAIGIAVAGSAAAGAIAEKPEVFGKVIIIVAFAEAVAVYGLLVALIILLGVGG